MNLYYIVAVESHYGRRKRRKLTEYRFNVAATTKRRAKMTVKRLYQVTIKSAKIYKPYKHEK